MVVAIETTHSGTIGLPKTLAYFSGIDSTSPTIEFAYRIGDHGGRLASDALGLNTGHTVGIYNDKMFYVAWPNTEQNLDNTHKVEIGFLYRSTD